PWSGLSSVGETTSIPRLAFHEPNEQQQASENCSRVRGQPAKMTERVRIDRLLVERGLFESRAKAQAAVIAGRVRADAVVIAKPSEQVAADVTLSAEPEHPWLSRGGVKLSAALDHFRFDPRDRVCLDVGASTGGFSEVLLARGARRVYAVD